MKRRCPMSAFGPLWSFESPLPHALVGASGGCRVTGSAHVPRAGSLSLRFGSNRSGPPPLLRYAGHPTSSASNHSCPRGTSTATVVPRALWWGAVWSEVKEEGRVDSTRSEQSVNRPGGHERNTAPRRSAPAQLFDGCLRRSAKNRKAPFQWRAFQPSMRVASFQ